MFQLFIVLLDEKSLNNTLQVMFDTLRTLTAGMLRDTSNSPARERYVLWG